MLENLPAKRACRQIIPNVTKPRVRKISQGILVKGKNAKKSKANVANTTVTAITKRILRNHNKRIYNRRLRQVRTTTKKQFAKVKSEKANNKTNNVDGLEVVEEQHEEKTPITSCTKELNDINVEDNITISKKNESKNVVQELGKKTKRFVKKITEKFQSNRKTFLKKTRNNSSDIIAVETNESKDSKETSNNIKLNDEPKENSKRLIKTNKETENKNITKLKNELKCNKSKQLLRKLSFRKSSRKMPVEVASKDSNRILDGNIEKTNSGSENLDSNNENVNISSTNLSKQSDGKKMIKKKRCLSKILNKFKEKSNKKLINSEETESKLHTAGNLKNKNDNALNYDTEMSDNKKITGNNELNCTDKNIVITKIDMEQNEKSLIEENNIIKDGITNITDLDVQPLNLSVQQPQNVLQVSPTTKKRSKKLNDCIAMLTGKLQEKLGKPFFESTENLDSALSRQSSTTDISQEPNNLSLSSLDLCGTQNNESKMKISLNESLEKKPPKRKTVTRKIIKKNNTNTSQSINKEILENDNGGDDIATGIILRPPILKVSSPKENISANSHRISEDCVQHTNNFNFNVESRASSSNGKNSENQKTNDVVKNVNQNNNDDIKLRSDSSKVLNLNSSEIVATGNDSNIKAVSENSSNITEGKRKFIRKVGRKKQNIAAKENTLKKLNKTENQSSNSSFHGNMNNSKVDFMEKDKASVKEVSKVLQVDEKVDITKGNSLRKKPGRKPKGFNLKTEESKNEMKTYDFTANVSKASQNAQNLKGNVMNGKNKKKPNKAVNKITNSSKKEILHNENEKGLTNSDVSLTEENVNGKTANKNNPPNKIDITQKKTRGRKPKVKPINNQNNLKVNSEMLPNNEKGSEKIKITNQEEPLNLAVQKKENSDLPKSLQNEKKKTDNKPNKSCNKKAMNLCLEDIKEPQVNEEGTNEKGNNISSTLKKKCGKKQEAINKELLPNSSKDIEISEVCEAINNENENAFKKESPGVVPKVETKKYTRKTKTKCDTKAMILDSFDALKQVPNSAVSTSSINLTDENQISVTSCSETVTLQNRLPLSLATIENRGVSNKEIKSKNIRDRQSEISKGDKKQNQNKSDKNQSLLKCVDVSDVESKNQKMKSMMTAVLGEKYEKQEKLSASDNARNNQKGQPCDKTVKVSCSLAEVEEIVASFLSDDDEINTTNTQLEQKSTDKPIRLDEAEAILTEHHEDVEKEISETSNKEKQSERVENCMPNESSIKDCVSIETCGSLNIDQTPFICKELSVSLVKLSDKSINAINEENSPQEKPAPKKRGRKKLSLKQKQSDEIVNIQSNNNQLGCDVVDSKVSEVKSNSPNSRIDQVEQNASNNSNNLTCDLSKQNLEETNSKTITEVEKVKSQKFENSNTKIKLSDNNDHNIDETSESSYLKSQDGSETDTRDGSLAKKQRKRRKNELAAIVADQLLESFKEVDKSKINDLKKLENLAYEKSEDLLLTGMRLTPTTKRKIASSSDGKDNTNLSSKTENKGQKRKSGDLQHKTGRSTRSKSQPNCKTISADVISNRAQKEDQLINETDDTQQEVESSKNKKRKFSPKNAKISNSHENLFRNLSKGNEPLKLNVEPLSQKHSFRICSNFNTTQFEIFSTFKSSFDTFRSQTDYSFMQAKDIVRKSNFMPGSTETSNSVDSQSLKQEESKTCDNGTSDKSKPTTFHKKLKKKLNRKKDKIVDSENINELRTGLELFSFEKDKKNDSLGNKSLHNKSFNCFDVLENTPTIATKLQISLSNPDISNKDGKNIDLHFLNENKKPLLRPSILKATLDTSKSLNSETVHSDILSKTISSRDPRLNKNKIQSNAQENDESNNVSIEKRKMGSIRQRRKSESLMRRNTIQSEENSNLNTAFIHPRERLRSSRKDKNLKQSINLGLIKNQTEVDNGRTEEDEDNYLSQIAKSVNDKIMSSEDEGDGFEMYNTDSILLLGTERPARPSTSMSLRSMPNINDDQSNADFLQDDDNTNTELIDMDLEDDVSVYTSFSQDVSRFTKKGKFHNKRRRRKSILFSRRPKKQNISDQPEELFNCDICNKSFKKSAALSKHQMTLTHIAKLSEHEYLNASKATAAPTNVEKKPESVRIPEEPDIREIIKENNNPTENSSNPIHPIEILDMEDKESEPAEELVNEGEAAAAMPVETEVPPEPMEPIVERHQSQPHPPTTSVINLLSQSGIEPISSPEQIESNYDRYQNVSSRIALSQEERLFYECCNMLKGSETPMVERTYPVVPYSAYDVPNKPVTPKSSERFSYLGSEVTGNFHHGTAYTVKSPMSQSRTSPRHAYPKIDVNQFSDISSDSNPAFPRAQTHPNMQSNGNYPTSDLANKAFPNYPSHHQSPLREVQNTTQTGIASFGGQEVPHTFQEPSYYAGEGRFTPTRFPIATADGGAAASLTARTFVNENHIKDFNVGREAAILGAYPNEGGHERNPGLPTLNQNFTSPIHSTSSQGSTTTTCRMKTKAAMKGYDNFKVSIPTLGLDMQQALERSPHGGCKLTALAEIALGSEAPITPNRYPPIQVREEICEKPAKIKHDINEKFAKKYQELIKHNMQPGSGKCVKKKDPLEKTGNKLGFKAKKNKHRSSNKNCDIQKTCEKEKDVYDFDDSEEMEPDEMKGSVRERTAVVSDRKSIEEKIVIPERPFKDIGLDEQQSIKFHKPDELNNQNEESTVSSTSYSDRDDFNYGSMSDNEDGNQDEERSSDSESNSSARTAKTIENKCLIMGRIFKKATKNRTEDKKSDSTVEQKKKLPTQELNKLFDSLREEIKEQQQDPITDSSAIVPSSASNIPKDSKVTTPSNESADCRIDTSKEEKETEEKNIEKRHDKEKASTNTKQIKSLKEDKKAKEEIKEKNEMKRRSRKDASKQQSKEIYKLQSELGMSPEEIASLINEGKRKSQRRCAANRPQKFVETWSSDEYEDFLSTKDIIAFIEEKEKKLRKKKSISKGNEKKKLNEKTNTPKQENNSSSHVVEKSNENMIDVCEKQSINVKSSAMDIINKKPEKFVDKLLEKISKAQKERASNMNNEKIELNTTKQSDEMKVGIKERKTTLINRTSGRNPLKKPTLSAKPRLKTKTADSESDFETEWRRSRTKIKKRRKTISFKERESVKKLSKPADSSRRTSGGQKTKVNNTSKENSTNKASSQNNESSKPLARRKRVASEMLYYWSSSSDEDFGRIETRDDDDDISPEGEHYQQHGWIVGDSHKKLVTLLAIAKGKKVEDCVVKETGYKKKS